MKKWKQFSRIAVTGVLSAAVLLTAAMPVSAAKKEKKRELDPKGTYHATLGIQTCDTLWITRMGYYAKEQNEVYGTKNADKLFYKDGNKIVTQPGTLNDVEIKGNGTYTVSLEAADFGGEKDISQLHVATDIPVNDTIQFSNVSAEVNGRKVASFDEAIMEDETNYLGGGMVVLVMNHWRAELVKYLSENGLPETAESGYTLLNGSGEETVSITFTVSGFDYDNEDAQTDASADTQSADEAGDTADADNAGGTTDMGNTNAAAGTGADESTSSSSTISVTAWIAVIAVVVIIAAAAVMMKRKKK